jgi:hypothetical protein
LNFEDVAYHHGGKTNVFRGFEFLFGAQDGSWSLEGQFLLGALEEKHVFSIGLCN